MELKWGSPLWEKLFDMFHNTRRPQGEGKHSRGARKSPYYRAQLKKRRKAERLHRRRVRRQAAGRKHVR